MKSVLVRALLAAATVASAYMFLSAIIASGLSAIIASGPSGPPWG